MTTYQLYIAVLGALTDEVAKTYLLELYKRAEEKDPCEDAISRQAVLEYIEGSYAELGHSTENELVCQDIKELSPVVPKSCEDVISRQFAEWVAREIFDDMWEYNKGAFAELACRKLAKIGIVRANGNEWELIEPQESEEK